MKDMKNKNMLQQGDVVLNKVNIDITNAVKVKKDRRGIVLAEGEVTFHYHGIECDETEAELIQLGEKMLLSVKAESVTLTHQEHNPVTIEHGIWEFGQVVEKDWLSGMVNPVRD